MKPATLLTFAVVNLIALLHVVRIIAGVELAVDGAPVPMWASVPAIVFFAALSVGLWREHAAPRPPTA